MKTFIKGTILVLGFGILFQEGLQAQQLPQFSQYMFNGLHINPGYAGYKGEPYIQSTYRNQWISVPGAPETFTITADMSLNEGRMGMGVSILSDNIGATNTNGAMFTYVYRIQTGRNSFLGMGVSAGVTEYAVDGSRLDPNDPDDPLIPEGRINLFTPNLNSGLFFHNDKFYAGFSVFNMVGKRSLEQEDLALGYHNFHYYLTAGTLFDLSEKVKFKPSFLVKGIKGAPTNYDINAMFLFNERIWVGGSYRSNTKALNNNLPENLSNRNALAAIIEIFATEKLRVGYAYDHNMNVLQDYRASSHEISLGYYMTPRRVAMRDQRWF